MIQEQYISLSIRAAALAMKLANAYNSIYIRAFEKVTKDARESRGKMRPEGQGGISYLTWFETAYNGWLEHVDEELEVVLKSANFTSLLSEYTKSMIQLRAEFRAAGYPVDFFDRMFDWSVRSQMVFSVIPKESRLAPHDVVFRKDKTRLLHYRPLDSAVQGQKRQPVLIVYAPINTFHILDLNPKRSVVRNLLSSEGLDIYLLDWGYPGPGDNELSIGYYLDRIDDALEFMGTQTNEARISVLGYCWGGLFALMHASLNPDTIRNLVVVAAPVDFSKDDSILAHWSRAIDVDAMMDEFGHMDGQVLNLGFLMRNPPRYAFDKYLRLLQRSNEKEFVDTFIDVERWLYDTPPIPGALHRQIMNDCYRKNLLISGELEVTERGRRQKVDLKKITMPTLSVVAESDDLVSPESSLAIDGAISSKDKSILKNPGGHVALCISTAAHERLWPAVAKWLISR